MSLPYETEIPDGLVDDIRLYFGDLPEFNRLIEGTEVSDQKIKLAVRLYTQHFNRIPPPVNTNYTPLNFPDYLILFHGVIIELMKMSGIIQSRNYLNFTDGGSTFSVNDKGQEYLQWISAFLQTHLQDVKELRISINAEEGFGHIDSPEAWYPDLY